MLSQINAQNKNKCVTNKPKTDTTVIHHSLLALSLTQPPTNEQKTLNLKIYKPKKKPPSR